MENILPASATTTPEKQIFSVSQLNRRARQLLETHLSLLWVDGEVSNLSRPASGHWYFTLKDDKAQIRCAMFRNRNRAVNFKLENGQQILVRGRVGLYENRGDYQLIAEHIEPAGLGELQRRFERLKDKLAEQGLFAPERKRELPLFPQHLGIITSPTGAALRDILHVLQRRFPLLPVTIYPCAVQGNSSVGEIVGALKQANQQGECDLLIVARGGGSIEDLWSFNEEAVALAMAASKIPLICGVGHETDTTIADFVADARAPTPSAAAELASPDGDDLLQNLQAYDSWFQQRAKSTLFNAAQQLSTLRKRLRHPSDIINTHSQHLDHLEIRLHKAMEGCVQKLQSRLQQAKIRHQAQTPQLRLSKLALQVGFLEERLHAAMEKTLAERRQGMSSAIALLQAVSPLNTLERGYAIVQNKRGQVISHIANTRKHDQVAVTLSDGVLQCVIDDVLAGVEQTPGKEH
ncbi:MAG: exodeoxyribonuclease VII large subunit [Porticoccaceae bacterium]|nr:exodeoxyribonuclease VII large subunit [Porticoccaceae bacterium]